MLEIGANTWRNPIAQGRHQLAAWRWRIAQCWAFQQHWGEGLPWRSRARLFQAHWQHLTDTPGVWPLIVPGYRYPVYFRSGTSDLPVIQENLVHQQYGPVGLLPDVRYIIDCGANIGTATFYLLHRYPQAKALIVEPDPRNLAIARRTLRPFGSRVRFVCGAVWSASGPLMLSRQGFRDSAEWSVQVRSPLPGETPDVQAWSMPDLQRLAGFPRVDLLKVDIEAAEQVVFLQAKDWLPAVLHLVIEIHDAHCEAVVSKAMQGYRRIDFGELTHFSTLSTDQGTAYG